MLSVVMLSVFVLSEVGPPGACIIKLFTAVINSVTCKTSVLPFAFAIECNNQNLKKTVIFHLNW